LQSGTSKTSTEFNCLSALANDEPVYSFQTLAMEAPPEEVTLFVAGTRTEAVKLASVILALRARGAATILVATGQHRELFHETLVGFELVADHGLVIMQRAQSWAAVIGLLVPALASLCETLRPAAVVVQGDTASAFAGAQAAVYARCPVAHVEASLRTGTVDPFPEEMHRRAIAQMADLHFAPTVMAADALRREGVAAGNIHVTGNTGIDALHLMAARLAGDAGLQAALGLRFAGIDWRRPLLLATIHRRENHGARLDSVLLALAMLAREAEIVLPVHPHPAVAGPVRAVLGGLAGVHLLPPLDYPAFLWLLQRATLVLTDSGGVQEEAPALGTPALVLRDVTERSQGIASGNARLVGTDTAAIIAAVGELLGDAEARARMAAAALPYGAGDAARQIVEVMLARFGGG
jgi:UDP-N-acetylglucosamine 2-epimerase (non-hydrolysing)